MTINTNVKIIVPCDICSSRCDIVMTIHEAQRHLKWGTYGKGGKDPLTWVRLIDCSTEHLKAIIKTQPQRYDHYDLVIKSILTDRGCDISNLE